MRALQTLLTLGGAVASSAFTFYALRTWAGVYLPGGTADALAAAGALGIPWLINKVVTRSFRKLEPDATEFGSIGGVTLCTHAVMVPLLALGLAGVVPQIAVQQAGIKAAVTLNLILPDDERALSCFPASAQGLGYLWAPNIGTYERPQVVARDADGSLRALNLGPRGTELAARTRCLIGPVDRQANKVMLVPIPEDVAHHPLLVEATWNGGKARFEMTPYGNKVEISDDAR